MAIRIHGGLEGSLDFSVNVNPYGPSAAMVAAIQAAPLQTYPDPRARQARAALAAWQGVEIERVALGAGAAELLWSLARAWVRPATSVLICEPTFCEFAVAAEACGGRVQPLRTELSAASLDIDELARAIIDTHTEVVYICAPNSPTGSCISADQLSHLATMLEAKGRRSRLIVDQSFLSLSTHYADATVAMPDNVIRVRSLTKDHGLCGVRVGYAIGSPDDVAALEAARPSWSTSTMAQAAAAAAPADADFVARSRATLLADCQHLRAAIARLGLRAGPTTTPFFLVEIDGAPTQAQLLREHHIGVRDCTSFGLPRCIRIGTRTPADNTRLLQALQAMVRP